MEMVRGDAVLLTAESSESIMGGRTRLPGKSKREAGGPQLVGIVWDKLDEIEEVGQIWGVLVNGEFHQVLEDEIAAVIPRDSADVKGMTQACEETGDEETDQ